MRHGEDWVRHPFRGNHDPRARVVRRHEPCTFVEAVVPTTEHKDIEVRTRDVIDGLPGTTTSAGGAAKTSGGGAATTCGPDGATTTGGAGATTTGSGGAGTPMLTPILTSPATAAESQSAIAATPTVPASSIRALIGPSSAGPVSNGCAGCDDTENTSLSEVRHTSPSATKLWPPLLARWSRRSWSCCGGHQHE
jgi:hypothetical protein